MNALIELLNRYGTHFVNFAGDMAIQSSLAIVVLLGLNWLLRDHTRAVFRYGLLLIILVKLVLPPFFAFPTGLGYWLTPSSMHAPSLPSGPNPPGGVINSVPTGDSKVSLKQPVTRIGASELQWQAVEFLVWGAGVAALVVYTSTRSIRLKRHITEGEPPAEPLLSLFQDCITQLGIRSTVRLIITDTHPCPAVCGLFRPAILLPRIVSKELPHDQLRAVLLHEMAHIKRGDLWINHIQALLQVVHWYHPLVWMAGHVIKQVREEAVDETVMVSLGERSETYPQTLISVARLITTQPKNQLGLLGIGEPKHGLSGRITRLIERPTPESSKLGAFGFLAVFLVAVLILPMAGRAKPQLVQKSRQSGDSSSPEDQSTKPSSDDAKEESPASADDIATSRKIANRGWKKESDKDYHGAIADFSQAIELDPQFYDALFSRASLYSSLHLPKNDRESILMAITDYNTILTKWPNSYPPRHNRAMCYGRLREYDKAIADYSMIIEQDLDYSNYGSPKEHAIAMAHHYRGRIFQWQKKDYPKAAKDYTAALRLDPSIADPNASGRIYLRLAQVHYALKDYNKAQEYFVLSFKNDPGYGETHQDYAWMLATCPDPDIRNGSKALEHAKKGDYRNGENLAAAYAELGQFDEAIQLQKKALKSPFPDTLDQREIMTKRLRLFEKGKPYRTQ